MYEIYCLLNLNIMMHHCMADCILFSFSSSFFEKKKIKNLLYFFCILYFFRHILCAVLLSLDCSVEYSTEQFVNNKFSLFFSLYLILQSSQLLFHLCLLCTVLSIDAHCFVVFFFSRIFEDEYFAGFAGDLHIFLSK